MRSRKQDDFKSFQRSREQPGWRWRQIRNIASDAVDVFSLVGQDGSRDVSTERDRDFERRAVDITGATNT
jgi:hypothetical protein